MAIKGIVVNGVNTAFKVLAELVETVTVLTGTSEYDPTTGIVTEGTAETPAALFLTYKKYDGERIKPGDQQLLIKVASLQTELDPQMTILRANGKKYALTEVVMDPTSTIYICNARRAT